jgi:hypothetical protein
MEITGLDTIHTVQKLAPKEALKEALHTAPIKDPLDISSDARKKADWVEKLKLMAPIRPERIEAALAKEHTSPEILATVAQRLMHSGF